MKAEFTVPTIDPQPIAVPGNTLLDEEIEELASILVDIYLSNKL